MLLGSNNFKALGLIKVEVTIKKISNKNTMSVMDDILKLGFAFLDLLIAIAIALFILLLVFHLINVFHKISAGRFHFGDNMIDFGSKGIVGKISYNADD